MRTDPVERVVAEALEVAGVAFVDERDPSSMGLDFYLPALDTHIEVKRFHTDRVLEQMKRSQNIIVIVGIDAARSFAQLINPTPQNKVKENRGWPKQSNLNPSNIFRT